MKAKMIVIWSIVFMFLTAISFNYKSGPIQFWRDTRNIIVFNYEVQKALAAAGFKAYDAVSTLATGDIGIVQDVSDTTDGADGTTKYFTMAELITLVIESAPYGAAWDGDVGGATKNAIYDQLHLYDTDDDGDIDSVDSTITKDAEHDTWAEQPALPTGYVVQGSSGVPAATRELFVRSFAVPTLGADELNDTSDPHTLETYELKGVILSNANSTGADEWDFPARTENWNFIFIKEANYNVRLDPNGTEAWYFRNDSSAYTQAGAGEAIVNETSGRSVISCFSTEAAVFCTGDANWEEDTP